MMLYLQFLYINTGVIGKTLSVCYLDICLLKLAGQIIAYLQERKKDRKREGKGVLVDEEWHTVIQPKPIFLIYASVYSNLRWSSHQRHTVHIHNSLKSVRPVLQWSAVPPLGFGHDWALHPSHPHSHQLCLAMNIYEKWTKTNPYCFVYTVSYNLESASTVIYYSLGCDIQQRYSRNSFQGRKPSVRHSNQQTSL